MTETTTIKARAFKKDMIPSSTASATYTIITPSGPPVATVAFAGVDITTSGTWKGVYGSEGFLVIGDSQNLPANVTITPKSASEWLWEYSTEDIRALQRGSGPARLASCWYGESFDVKISVPTDQPRLVSVYCMDWDNAGRVQSVEFFDYLTGSQMHALELSDFAQGAHLNYVVQGEVILRLTRIQSHNAVMSGIFINPAE